jgi:hypothetical protein
MKPSALGATMNIEQLLERLESYPTHTPLLVVTSEPDARLCAVSTVQALAGPAPALVVIVARPIETAKPTQPREAANDGR